MNILARLKTSPWHMEVPTSEAMVVDLASDSFCGKRQNQIGCCELEMSMIEGRLVYLLGSPPEKSLDTVSRYHKCSLEYTARLKQIYDRRNPALAPSSSKLPLIGGAPLARSALLSLDLPSSDIFGRNRLHVALYYEAFDEYPKSVISLEMARHKDRLGLTPLHIASIQGHSQCVKLLLELDVEHNARDDCLLTPLHYAAGFGHEEVVSLLLERYRFRNDEESIYATDQNRKTPLDLATAGEHDKVVEMLRKPASDVASGTSTGWSSHLEAPQDFTLGMKTPPIGVPVPSNPLPPLSRYFQTFDDPGTLATVETNDDSEGVWYLQCIVDGCHMKNKPWSDGEGFLRHLNGAHNWTSNFLEPEDLKQYLVRWHRVPLP
ncbi:ankyrin repeat-containing domain protein [Lasiosphaeria miniovina]|uniref:Ankyrin repeat-containing domain protein n=1 Tax=Lasiosphaeria miniovina TaxID=1954250 RepID=A0AA40ACJ0_9PEZI|nr:ankyrin repeat-containing domain protein [Lasiosphaeria miniovina]KAK0713386.1 ankyrin repeat-containing domain protein [Lasiosphaeria miniovina]